MLIILEGQRCSGKTSAAPLIAELLTQRGYKAEVKKFEKSEGDKLVAALRLIVPLALDDDKIWVIDRGHITEMVYRSLDRLNDALSFDDWETIMGQMSLIDSILASLDSRVLQIFLYADASILELRRRNTSRKEEGNVVVIGILFDTLISKSHIATTQINTEYAAPEDVAQIAVLDYITM